MNYKEIIKTITELLEIQEGVKIHYKVKDESEKRRENETRTF